MGFGVGRGLLSQLGDLSIYYVLFFVGCGLVGGNLSLPGLDVG
ncbi:hypothetical protein [Rosistilla oblonga]|nr:hypothetical protein [Rosistilla oblonga]